MNRNGTFLKDQPAVLKYWGPMVALGSLPSPSGDVSVFHVAFDDNVPHGPHSHPHHDEHITVAKGRIEQTIGEITEELGEGDAAIIPRGVTHSAKPLSPGTVVVVVLFGEGTQYESQEQFK